jgi:hypothetical protein
MDNQTTSFVVELEELIDPTDEENDRAARNAHVAAEAFETILSPPAE